MQNSAFWTRVTSLYGSQTWPVVLCMYNSGLNIRITCLYGSQPSRVVFGCKTAPFGPNNKSLWVTDITCRFVHAIQRWLAPELLVAMGPYPYLWFLHSKQRLLEPNNKSLRIPDISCRRVHAIKACTRITCLYGSQPLSVVFGCKTATFWAELQVSMGPRHDLSFCGCKTAC